MKKKSLCLDFDGYLCKYESWMGHGTIGAPIKDKILMVKFLNFKGCILKLSTTRLNPFPFGEGLMDEPDKVVLSGQAKEYIMNWLKEQNILHCFKEITGYKPYADYYLDDRGWNPTPEELYKVIFPKEDCSNWKRAVFLLG